MRPRSRFVQNLLFLVLLPGTGIPVDTTFYSKRGTFHHTNLSCRYAIVQPIADKTSLHLESDGLAILREILSPVAPVVVIGPYRSGKSFLLNQLLGVGCGTSCSDDLHDAQTTEYSDRRADASTHLMASLLFADEGFGVGHTR